MSGGIPFGEYRLLRRLGAGGMAEVFLAKRIGPGGFEKQLVIKRILPHLSASERFTSMFLREARLAALVDHPNLVHVSSFGEIDGRYYLAMEYVDGLTLADLCQRLGALTPGVAGRIAIDILAALSAIHRAGDDRGQPLGLVHRDITPRNVMVTKDGGVKLLDFGIAVSTRSEEAPTRVGTRRYMSPEQMAGAPLDGRSDLFSVGVLVYEMIVGTVPYSGDKAPAHVPDQPESMPDELWEPVRRALAPSPEERPESAQTLQAPLELFLATRGMEGTRTHLAQVVSQVTPIGRTARALSRITQLTGISRFTQHATALPNVAPRRRQALTLFGLAAASLLAVWIAWPSAADRANHSSEATSPPAQPKHAAVEASHTTPPASPVTSTVADAAQAPPSGQPIALDFDPFEDEETALGAPSDARRPGTEKKAKKKRVRFGQLTIDTRPWTEVYLGERRLGLTPMEGVKLPPGRHVLTLKNPELGLVKRLKVTIRSGETTRVQRSL